MTRALHGSSVILLGRIPQGHPRRDICRMLFPCLFPSSDANMIGRGSDVERGQCTLHRSNVARFRSGLPRGNFGALCAPMCPPPEQLSSTTTTTYHGKLHIRQGSLAICLQCTTARLRLLLRASPEVSLARVGNENGCPSHATTGRRLMDMDRFTDMPTENGTLVSSLPLFSLYAVSDASPESRPRTSSLCSFLTRSNSPSISPISLLEPFLAANPPGLWR